METTETHENAVSSAAARAAKRTLMCGEAIGLRRAAILLSEAGEGLSHHEYWRLLHEAANAAQDEYTAEADAAVRRICGEEKEGDACTR